MRFFMLSTFKQFRPRNLTNHYYPGYEEEAPRDNYFARESFDDGYSPSSPSPPHASGGSYRSENTGVPPPPLPPAGYTQPYAGTVPVPNPYEAAHPPYDPVYPPYDPAHPPYDPAQPPHSFNPAESHNTGNVSSTTPFAPLAKTPVPRSMYNIADEEGAS